MLTKLVCRQIMLSEPYLTREDLLEFSLCFSSVPLRVLLRNLHYRSTRLKMSISDVVGFLTAELSISAKVLLPGAVEFKGALERWSLIGLKIPGAIVMITTEEDIISTVCHPLIFSRFKTLILQVKLAVKHEVPFVPKSGGHSAWSTIGPEGIIIDLSNYKKVTVNNSAETVTIQPGVLNKQLNEALFAEERCTRAFSLPRICVVTK